RLVTGVQTSALANSEGRSPRAAGAAGRGKGSDRRSRPDPDPHAARGGPPRQPLRGRPGEDPRGSSRGGREIVRSPTERRGEGPAAPGECPSPAVRGPPAALQGARGGHQGAG